MSEVHSLEKGASMPATGALDAMSDDSVSVYQDESAPNFFPLKFEDLIGGLRKTATYEESEIDGLPKLLDTDKLAEGNPDYLVSVTPSSSARQRRFLIACEAAAEEAEKHVVECDAPEATGAVCDTTEACQLWKGMEEGIRKTFAGTLLLMPQNDYRRWKSETNDDARQIASAFRVPVEVASMRLGFSK